MGIRHSVKDNCPSGVMCYTEVLDVTRNLNQNLKHNMILDIFKKGRPQIHLVVLSKDL